MFFLSETARNPKHVGALQIFELPVRAPKNYLKNLVATMKQALPLPPFNYTPHFPLTGMPQWREDPDIDMDYHVGHTAVPGPGDTRQLLEVVGRLHGGILDRHRPCWICRVIEGLEGRRFAVYTKVHHSYVDGISGVQRMCGGLSTSRGSKDFIPIWAHREEKPARREEPGVMQRVSDAGHAAIGLAGAVTEVYEILGKMGLQWLNLHDSYNQIPFDAPRTLMNRPVEWDARAVGICTLPLDRVKAAGLARGGKVNDVVLTVVDAALHDYLEHRGENTDKPLVALCPMSLRESGDDTANTQVSALHVRMGDPGADIDARLQQVIDSASKAKQEAREMSRNALMDAGILIFGAWEFLERSGLEWAVPASYNVLLSNIHGPVGDEMYMLGSRLIACYPISTFLPGTNLNVTVLSHGNSIDFGLLADKHAMPDVDRVAGFIEKRFAELERKLPGAPRKKKAPAVKGRKKSAKA